MQAVQDIQGIKECNKHLSGFDLTMQLIRSGLKKLGLNANAKLVLMYLATCYNEKNGCVYPRVKTMAEALDISERGVIRALAELTEKGCIIRSKRGNNKNVYVITLKVANDDTTKGHDVITSNDTVSLPCHEVKQHEVKEQQQMKKAVVSIKEFKGVEEKEAREESCTADSPSFSKTDFKEIPLCLKRKADKGEIRNLGGYWRSLRPAVKMEYIEQDRQEREAAERKAELKRQRELREAAEREEARKRQEELSKPLTEQMTRAKAVLQVQMLYKTFGRRVMKFPRTEEIIRAFEISEAELSTTF